MSKSHKYCKVGQLWFTFMHTPGEDNERHALQRVWSRRVGLFHGHWEMLPLNWLQVLDTAECSQVDHCVCQQLHAIVSLLDAFKTEQQALKLIFPGKGALDPQA